MRIYTRAVLQTFTGINWILKGAPAINVQRRSELLHPSQSHTALYGGPLGPSYSARSHWATATPFLHQPQSSFLSRSQSKKKGHAKTTCTRRYWEHPFKMRASSLLALRSRLTLDDARSHSPATDMSVSLHNAKAAHQVPPRVPAVQATKGQVRRNEACMPALFV